MKFSNSPIFMHKKISIDFVRKIFKPIFRKVVSHSPFLKKSKQIVVKKYQRQLYKSTSER